MKSNCPKCGGKWRPWAADGVRGKVCENGCQSRALPPKRNALKLGDKGQLRIGGQSPSMARHRPESVAGRVRALFLTKYTGTRRQVAAHLGLDEEPVRKAIGHLVTRGEIYVADSSATYSLRPVRR